MPAAVVVLLICPLLVFKQVVLVVLAAAVVVVGVVMDQMLRIKVMKDLLIVVEEIRVLKILVVEAVDPQGIYPLVVMEDLVLLY
jgi:hypothetical protein